MRLRDTYLECDNLEEGEYFLYIEIDWQTESAAANHNFCITSYGVSKLTFLDVTPLYQ